MSINGNKLKLEAEYSRQISALRIKISLYEKCRKISKDTGKCPHPDTSNIGNCCWCTVCYEYISESE